MDVLLTCLPELYYINLFCHLVAQNREKKMKNIFLFGNTNEKHIWQNRDKLKQKRRKVLGQIKH